MEKNKNEKFIILLVSLACVGLTIESIVMKWEFWVPPLIILGTIFLWVMNLSERPDYETRKVYYLIYAMLTVFYHGVHETSFFDVALVATLVLIAYSFFDHIYMMNLIMLEYIIIMFIQFILAHKGNYIDFDTLNISRVILHMVIVLLMYISCVRSIRNRFDEMEIRKSKDDKIEAYESDMDDFLSNISHELRTPVNVVNGMSDLMIKRNAGEEAYSIKSAGRRLAYQIEDIQDYNECKREKMLLMEEEYMSTTLINDVVNGYRLSDVGKDLELIVDFDPRVPKVMKGDIVKLNKIFRHLLDNAVKFTKKGGILIKMYAEETAYGVNLGIEMTDTGIGMDRMTIRYVSEGFYQANKKRNRSSGGIGLGLPIVYGFVHKMGGFIKIESVKGSGTTVRVTIPQKVVDKTECLALSNTFEGDIIFHVRSDKYKVPKVRDFYRVMAANLASGIHVPLYSAETLKDIEHLREKLNVTHIFMGEEEYADNPEYFEELSRNGVVVSVNASDGFKTNPDSNVIVMPKPLYAYPIIKILNDGQAVDRAEFFVSKDKPFFDGVRALVVDDEPMNLVVATGLFNNYKMEVDTARSGKEAINKYRNNDYDIVFIDHMMPEMDGVAAMKHIREIAEETDRTIVVVVLTANVVSGAKELFIKEGFDEFIAKPINIAEFERVMLKVLPQFKLGKEAEA